jgi:hypothetical protein
VTFFFNGGVEKQFDREERMMVPSPKVATYDKQPEMSVQGVADKVAEVVKSSEYDFVMCNFAPPDMVSRSHRIACGIADRDRLVTPVSTTLPSSPLPRLTRLSRRFTTLVKRLATCCA